MPSVVQQGATIDLVLRVGASSRADPVLVEILPNAGYELVKGKRTWSGVLNLGETLDLAITIRCVKVGEWSLGARISNGSGKETEVSGALVGLIVLEKTRLNSFDINNTGRFAMFCKPARAL